MTASPMRVCRRMLLRFFNKGLIDPLGRALLLFHAHHFMAGGVTPGRHVLLDAFVVRDDFQHLAQS